MLAIAGCVRPNCEFEVSNIYCKMVYDSTSNQWAIKDTRKFGEKSFLVKSKSRSLLSISEPDNYYELIADKDSCVVKGYAYKLYKDQIEPEILEKQKANKFK